MDKAVRSMYCLRCRSKQVLRGSLGESAQHKNIRGFGLSPPSSGALRVVQGQDGKPEVTPH